MVSLEVEARNCARSSSFARLVKWVVVQHHLPQGKEGQGGSGKRMLDIQRWRNLMMRSIDGVGRRQSWIQAVNIKCPDPGSCDTTGRRMVPRWRQASKVMTNVAFKAQDIGDLMISSLPNCTY